MLWAQNNIVLLDVSGSMNGIKGENLMPKVREQLIPFVNSLDSASIKVIPFTNRVLGQFDAREFISRPIVAQKGNTNIQKAVSALPELMGEEVNRIFLVTDGQQTSGVSTEVFAQQLSALKEANEKDYYYLVALSDKVKETPIAGVFDGTNKFVLLDSLYFPEEHPVTQCEQDTTSSPVVSKLADVSGKENGSSFNWWWLLLIVLASLVVLLVIVVLLGYSSVLIKFICEVYYIVQSFAKKIYDNIMEKLRKLFSRDDKELERFLKKSMKNRMSIINKYCSLPDSLLERHHVAIQMAVREWKSERMKQLPKDGAKGHWRGKKGNGNFIVDETYMFRCKHADEEMSIADWKKRFCIGQDSLQIQYKNGEPDFRKYSPVKVKVEYKPEYDYDDIECLHDPVIERLAKEAPYIFAKEMRGDVANPITDRREHLALDGSYPKYAYNVFHEARDGETVFLVPNFIHKICTHTGGRKLARIVQEDHMRSLCSRVCTTP